MARNSSLRRVFVGLGIVVGVWAVAWPGHATEAVQPDAAGELTCSDCNVLMISLANVSAEHMSLYGYERLTTPHLTRWAQDAVVFERAFTHSSWTLPVATSLFTSLYPYTHKVIDRFQNNDLDDTIQTLPEILQDHGYRTAAFTGGLDYDGRFGHMRGFEEVEESAEMQLAAVSAGFKPALAKASQWLDDHAGEKFFLFLHGYDTHCPFDPPEHVRGTFATTAGKQITVDQELCLRGFKTSDDGSYEAYYYRDGAQQVMLTQDDIAYLEALYDEELLSVDGLIGAFVSQLDPALLERTIIIIFSDHGEMFAKHGRFGRAGTVRGTLYDEVAHIPLMIKIPRHAGRTVSGLAQIIDVMPTLLEVLQVDGPSAMQGTSLLPLLTGRQDELNPYVFAGSIFGLHTRRPSWLMFPFRTMSESIRNQEWKLIHERTFDEQGAVEHERYELYHLRDDPGELRNRAQDEPAIRAILQAELHRWAQASLTTRVRNFSSPDLLPKALVEGARERGYW